MCLWPAPDAETRLQERGGRQRERLGTDEESREGEWRGAVRKGCAFLHVNAGE